MPDGPIVSRDSGTFTPPEPAREVPRTVRETAQMGRMSGPMLAPGSFVPPLNPKADPRALQAEHDRLHPEDRFRGGIQNHPGRAPSMVTNQPPTTRLGSAPTQPAQNLNPNYPAWRYHKTVAPEGLIVNDPDHEGATCKGDGWQKTPIPAPKGLTTADKLELLEDLMEILAGQSSDPEETPIGCLNRLIAERDDFAKKFAAASKEPKK